MISRKRRLHNILRLMEAAAGTQNNADKKLNKELKARSACGRLLVVPQRPDDVCALRASLHRLSVQRLPKEVKAQSSECSVQVEG
jgi:hypothetical protein